MTYIPSAEDFVLIGSILLFISIIAGRAGSRLGVPVLLLFLVVGMLAGSEGAGLQFDNPKAAQFIGVISLSIILFSGGMDTKFSEIRPVLAQGIVLSTLGVLLTTVFCGLFIYWVTGQLDNVVSYTLLEALLLAAVMSSTDSASVFAILRSKGLSLKQNLRPTLELESGSNDPMAYLLTIILIQVITSSSAGFWEILSTFLLQIVIGSILGYLLGRLTVKVINRICIDNNALYSVLLLSCAFFIFSFTDTLQGNGYLAVYIAGLVVGNARIAHKKSIMTFFDGLAWLFQIIMFLTLGLLVNPSELLSIWKIGLLIGIFMIVFARPLSVFLCLAPFRKITLKAKTYISWVGLRGAVPIIFATYPLIAGVNNSQMIFNIVFFITLLSLLIQGTTVPWAARLLGLANPQSADTSKFNLEFSEDIKKVVSEFTVTDDLLSKGHRLMNLPFPESVLVVMIKRDGVHFIPKGATELFPGDTLMVIADDRQILVQTYRDLKIDRYTFKS